MAITLTSAEIQYVDDNLQDKTIIKIAREITEQRGGEEKIRRRDIISFFKDTLKRNLIQEKFGK